jgi:hypothetical protein
MENDKCKMQSVLLCYTISVYIMFRVKQILAALSLALLPVISYAPTVTAQESSSSSYRVSEVSFGSGGQLRACSSAYCAKQAAGELAVGSTSSQNYQARAGSNTDRIPLLEMIVTGGPVHLGVLEEGSVKYGYTEFSVRTYLAHNYDVIVDGSPPRNPEGHILAPMTSADISRPGTEQFGINLRQNTTPNIGSDPQQFPDNTFSFGAAALGYNAQNTFKFASGDVIALSNKSSGRTDYTLSMIANITPNTPSGTYAGKLVLTVVPVF